MKRASRGFGRLAGRKALITGADSGIGRAAAIAFAREGADIVLNYLPSEAPDAAEVVTLIEDAGRKAHPVPGDVSDENFCRQLIEQSVKALGGIDILVNVAGAQKAQEHIEDLTTEQFDHTFKTNVYAMFWLCKAALAHMQPGATIINTAFHTGLPALRDSARLCSNQGCHRGIHQGSGKAGRAEGNSSECCSSWSHMDATST